MISIHINYSLVALRDLTEYFFSLKTVLKLNIRSFINSHEKKITKKCLANFILFSVFAMQRKPSSTKN